LKRGRPNSQNCVFFSIQSSEHKRSALQEWMHRHSNRCHTMISLRESTRTKAASMPCQYIHLLLFSFYHLFFFFCSLDWFISSVLFDWFFCQYIFTYSWILMMMLLCLWYSFFALCCCCCCSETCDGETCKLCCLSGACEGCVHLCAVSLLCLGQ